MEEKNIILTILGAVLLVAVGGMAIVFSSSSTGMYSIYPQTAGNQIVDMPDPHTQTIAMDEGVCQLARARPATFETFAQRQCDYLNPGRASRQGDCMYQAKLDAQTQCISAPVFANIQQPSYLV